MNTKSFKDYFSLLLPSVTRCIEDDLQRAACLTGKECNSVKDQPGPFPNLYSISDASCGVSLLSEKDVLK